MLERLKGECRINELCNAHGISQGMYYKLRDQRLTDGAKLSERGEVNIIPVIDWNVKPEAQRDDRRIDHRIKRPIDKAA